MGSAIPQVITSDRASGAQVIDGSLTLQRANANYLTRAIGTEGNRRTWTYSCWIKRDAFPAAARQLWGQVATAGASATGAWQLYYAANEALEIHTYSLTHLKTNAVYRDTGWYHVVQTLDTTSGTADNRVRLYINGVEQTSFATRNNPSENQQLGVNTVGNMVIGTADNAKSTYYIDAKMAQCYFIDGQALGPENFGFTDPLTNTWRPKKYTGDFNIGSSDYSGTFAPYSTSARFNSFKTYTNVNENATSYTLPMGNPSHYGGKALDLASGGFQVQTNNSAAGDFFMAIWVNLDSYETSKQMGVDIAGNYVYFETVSSGAVKIRHNGSGGNTSNSGYANDTNQWQHWALSRSGGSLRAFVDGEQIVTDTGGISGDNTVLANSKFNFFGADNNTTSYNINGQVIDAVIYIGQGVSGNFTPPTAPLIDSSGNINHYSGFSDSQLYFASPLVDVSGSDPNTISDYYTTGANSFYLPMDGNSPIGQDKSGNGNDFTPVNFGGSVELDNPSVSGARPILNTTQGGTQAGVGVFGSKENKTVTVTVASKTGGGNAYFFDSVERDSLATIRGSTITFDTTDSTNNSHPFKLSSTNADSSGGTEYTDGVAYYINGSKVSGSDYVSNYSSGAASGFRGIKWTVPHNVSTTYYYCTVHNGMGEGGRLTSTTDETKADPYAWKCILAVPGTGGDYTDVSAQINCTSTTKASSAGGDPSSDGSCNFYGSSIDLDGNDKVTYTRTNAGDFSGQSDFTIEAWFNTDTLSATDAALFSNWDSGNNRSILFGPNASGNGKFTFIFNTTGSGGWTTLIGADAVAGKWVHVAWVYDHSATRHYAYINGILQGSTTGTAYNNSTANFILGVNKGDGSGYYNGKVQDLRYYHAVKYTASGTTAGEVVFTLPSTSPDILPDTPSGVSGGSKLTKITDGAVAFDGTGDQLEVTGPGTLAASSNWCIELTAYCNSSNDQGTYRIVSAKEGTNAGEYWMIRYRLGSITFNSGNNYKDDVPNIMNRWVHLAMTKSGNTVRGFVDGKKVWENTSDSSSTDITTLVLGGGYGSENWPGFISNARFVNGSSVYTADFTPPTAPLTNITNTYLLCCQSNTSATEAAVKPGTITANGDAAATNFNPFNTDINTVRGQETGYPTWNPLLKSTSTLSNGNLTLTTAASGYLLDMVNMFTPAGTGRWYWEFVTTARAGTDYTMVGMLPSDNDYKQGNGNTPHEKKGISVYIGYNGDVNAFAGAATAGSGTATFTIGDVLGWAFDAENGTVECYKNGESQGTQFTNVRTDVGWAFCLTDYDHTNASTHEINFGQKPFKFSPPDGFQPLNNANARPVKVITRPDHYVGTILYVGAGATKTFTGLNFGDVPDLVWMKNRDRASYGDGTSAHHYLYDTVRGTGTGKMLTSSTNEAQGSKSTEADLDGFVRDGFRLDAASGTDCINNSGDDFVAWCWKAGGNKSVFNVDDVGYASAAAAGLSAGTIPPTGASVGTKQGFSIIKYEGNGTSGAQLPHGLTQAPDFVVVKNLEETESWGVYHSAQGGTKYAFLNSDNGFSASSALWNNTNTTSSVLTLGNYNGTNKDDIDFIAYLWHDVPGLQKFGSYTGNGDADGPFVELGFRPAILMVKEVNNNSTRWCVWDVAWDDNNPMGENLFWNSKDAKSDSTNHNFDLLSNGFKARTTSDNRNRDDATYVYAAWAEAPTFNLYGGQSNTR